MIGQLLIDRYLVVRQLGEGGFSKTYLVRDKYLPNFPLCVVKRLDYEGHEALTLEQAKSLFHREAEILQRLGRSSSLIPGLLALIEDPEHPMLVMEYVEGQPYEDFLSQGRLLKPKAIAPFLRDVLAALEAVHGQGLIHQDLKPSNLIASVAGETALIDFGSATKPGETPFTGITLGTPGYFPPEQREGKATFSSDLYALGITTIQLLTGVTPQQIKRHPSSNELDWEPYLNRKRLSPRIIQVINRLVRTRPSERYQSAADALRELLSTEAVATQRTSRPIPAVATFLPWLFLPLIGLGLFLGRGELEAFFSIVQERIAENSTPDLDSSLTLLHDVNLPVATQEFAVTPRQTLATADEDGRIRLWDLQSGQNIKTLDSGSTITTIAISGDGRWLVGGSPNQRLSVFDLSTGRQLGAFQAHSATIKQIAVNGDGHLVASSAVDRTIRLWDLREGRLLKTITPPVALEDVPGAMVFTPTNLLVCSTRDERIRIWSPQVKGQVAVFSGHTQPISLFESSPDGRLLFSFGEDRALLWNLSTDELVRVLPQESAQATSAVVNGDYLITAHRDGQIRLWNRKDGRLLQTVADLEGTAHISPDAGYLVNQVSDRQIKIWKLTLN